MNKQYTTLIHCTSHDRVAEVLNSWPTVQSTDELVAHIDHFQIVPYADSNNEKWLAVYVLWREVPR
jgi:hypothetical protein